MGTQKNRQNETVLSSPHNKCGKWWIKNYSQFYAELFCLSWHTTYDRARMELKQLMSQSMNFGSYSISEQRLLRRAYTNAHIRQSFHWTHTQNWDGVACSPITLYEYIVYWASRRENLLSGVREQQRRRPGCTSVQSEQRPYYLLFEKYYIYKQNFSFLVSFCSSVDWFGYDLVEKPLRQVFSRWGP